MHCLIACVKVVLVYSFMQRALEMPLHTATVNDRLEVATSAASVILKRYHSSTATAGQTCIIIRDTNNIMVTLITTMPCCV